MASYRIQHTTLEALADQVRSMCGTTQRLTPAEMLQWLQNVKYIPQAWANNHNICLCIDISNAVSCNHPQVRFGSAATAFRFEIQNFTSTLT